MNGIGHTIEIVSVVFSFLFGISIGSFLNVVILRLPKGMSIVRPASRCPKCGYVLRWYDNIPLLSYILLAGKCRKCRTPISIQYPLVELLSGVLAVACYYRFGLTPELGVYFVFVAALIAVTFIDIPYQIIPNEISIPGALLGVGVSFFTRSVTWQDSLIGAVLGFGLIAVIAYGYFFLTKREGMGMGDAKLLAMIGAFLGWQSIPFVLLAGSVQGVIFAVITMGFGLMRKEAPLPDPEEWEDGERPVSREEVPLRLAAIPFGPFLSLAALEFLFFGTVYYRWLTQCMGAY